MTNYKLSIIVPAFNLENKIKDTFNSIQNQTIGFENIELIFVDDNSTDNTLEIITGYADNYNNVKVFKTVENSKFAGKPRNIGLENSTSNYILFLDGDDQLLINSCEVLLDNITSNNGDITIGAHINHYDNTVQEHHPPLYCGRNEVFENGSDENLLNITPAISAKLFNKELLTEKQIRFAEGIPGQDLVFLVEVLLNSNKVNILNNNYIYYRNINKESISLNPNETYLYGLIKAYTLLCELFNKFAVEFEVQLSILQKHLGFFSMQILRAYNLKKIDKNTLNNIFSSEIYFNFINQSIFKNNKEFDEFFKCLNNHDYHNARIAINKTNVSNIALNNYSNLKNEISSLKIKQKELVNELTNVKNDNNALNEKNTQLTEQNQTAQEHINTLTEKNTQLTEQIEIVQENINTIRTHKNKLITENKTITENNNTLNKKNKHLTKKIKTLKDNNNRLNEKNTKLTEQIQTAQENINTIRTHKNKLITENKSLTQNYSSLKEENKKLNNKNEFIIKQNQTLINNNTLLKDENKTIKNYNLALHDANENLNKENNTIKNRNEMLKEQNDRLTEQNNNLNNNFADLKNDFEDTKLDAERIISSNKHLTEENTNLKVELNEIKSSRLWKLKNKF